MDIYLPWWGWAYLLFVLCVYITSFLSYGHFEKNSKTDVEIDRDDVIASSFSLFSICVFVIGFFNGSVVSFLSVMILPMVAIGVFWEFTRAVKETAVAQAELGEEQDLTDGERSFLLNVAIWFNAAVVVPGYVMGIVVAARVVKSLIGAGV